jgi:hypothetical protein
MAININDYVTMQALEDDLMVSFNGYTLEYCIDGDGDWKTLLPDEYTPAINTGHYISFRGNL